ncbi:MAG: DNA topoisomerase IB [Actinomycetota bacterium]|nr:DNA topoisomerase IB [Actinomycetota bacterium]
MKPLFAPVHFGSDLEPGIRRRGSKRFTYVDERTKRAPSSGTLERIRALAVPPAWSDVWIAADAGSHLQATGRDARGRKQYRYHPAFTESQSENKFDDLVPFAQVLGSLRSRVTRDLGRAGLSHDRVVATVVRLLDVTSLRVGNIEYARANRSFGLTTLRNRHVAVRGTTIRLTFRGKSAHDFDVTVDNARLAKIVRACQHLPGQQLFEYTDVDGSVRALGSSDVNTYLGEHGGPGVTAKTFRTWNATVRAAEGLADIAELEEAPTKRVLNTVVDQVADQLGNTRSICRNSYVHPTVVDAYLDGSLLKHWRRPVGRRPSGLMVSERRTLRLLR